MLCKPFYEIDSDTYLFREKLISAGGRNRPEESVRQWCAYELIRAYGISLRNIEFERKVRMGSRPHRIDILISQGGKPSVVVECKKASNRDVANAMEQARSYAMAPEIQAEFVVFTNGKDWHVQRRIQERWCTVPDLPREIDQHSAESITDLLQGLTEVAPILFKLEESLSGRDAERFLSAMQRLFAGSSLLKADIDRDLGIATDNLLRVMACADAHENYRYQKLMTALQHFQIYQQRRALETEFYFKRDPIEHEIQYLHAALAETARNADDLPGGEVFLIRVLTALTEYGMMQGARSNQLFPRMGPSLHRTLHDYLNYALIVRLGYSLPDHVDRILIDDMRKYCRLAWEDIEKEECVGFFEALRIWASSIGSKLVFWRR